MGAREIAAPVFIWSLDMAAPYEEMGYQLTLWVGAAGGAAGTQITSAIDVDYDLDPKKSSTTNRGTGGNVPIETENVVSLKPQITWGQHNNQNDAFLATLLAAAIVGLPVSLKVMTLAGATLLSGDFTLGKKLTAALDGTQVYEFTATATKQAGRSPTLG